MNANLYRCDCGVLVSDHGKPGKCPACGSKGGAGSSAGTPFERIDPAEHFDL